jgi:hypothetical protein
VFHVRKILFTAVLVAIVLPLSVVQAKPYGAPPKGGPGLMAAGPQVMNDLNLSAKQIDLLEKKKVEKRKTMINLHSQLQLLQVDLAEAANRNNPDMKSIEAMSRKVGDIHGQMTAERIKSIVYLRSVLNDDQRKIMDAHRLEFGMMRGMKPGGKRR